MQIEWHDGEQLHKIPLELGEQGSLFTRLMKSVHAIRADFDDFLRWEGVSVISHMLDGRSRRNVIEGR